MRSHVHALVGALVVAAGAGACGLRAVGGAERAEDGTAASAPSNVETRAPTPPCTGCDGGSPDAGEASTPVLACESYRSCPSEQTCCFNPQTGSHCAKTCDPGAVVLCRLGIDGCGSDYECSTMAAPPASGIGVCVED